MKHRRHTNTKGIRQVERGRTVRLVNYLKRKMKIGEQKNETRKDL